MQFEPFNVYTRGQVLEALLLSLSPMIYTAQTRECSTGHDFLSAGPATNYEHVTFPSWLSFLFPLHLFHDD